MDHVLHSLGIMLCAHILYEFLTWLSNTLNETGKYKVITLALTVISIGCGMLSFPFFALSAWYEQKFRKVHKEIFLEDRKPYEDALNGQISDLSAENKRLARIIEFEKDSHRREIARISEERYESGYRSGYVSGFKNGFDYCLDRTEYSGSNESELRADARSVANYDARKLFQERALPRNSEPTYLMESANGMIVRVPESKLDVWQKAQEGQGRKPTAEQKRIIKEMIVRDIYGTEPENK